MQHDPRDLFGEVPILRCDVYAWLLSVPRIDPTSPKAAQYVRGYSVIEKITVAKLARTFHMITIEARSSNRYRELLERLDADDRSTSQGADGIDALGVLPLPPQRKHVKPLNRAAVARERALADSILRRDTQERLARLEKMAAQEKADLLGPDAFEPANDLLSGTLTQNQPLRRAGNLR